MAVTYPRISLKRLSRMIKYTSSEALCTAAGKRSCMLSVWWGTGLSERRDVTMCSIIFSGTAAAGLGAMFAWLWLAVD